MQRSELAFYLNSRFMGYSSTPMSSNLMRQEVCLHHWGTKLLVQKNTQFCGHFLWSYTKEQCYKYSLVYPGQAFHFRPSSQGISTRVSQKWHQTCGRGLLLNWFCSKLLCKTTCWTNAVQDHIFSFLQQINTFIQCYTESERLREVVTMPHSGLLLSLKF